MKRAMVMESFVRGFLLLTLVSLWSQECWAVEILMVGDSMSEFMGQSLESFCGGSTVFNAGLGGTTAEQWAEYEAEVLPQACGSDWEVVYISVGGNDVLESECSISVGELRDRIERAIENIAFNIAPSASKYVLTGYCMPASPEEDNGGGCSDPSNYSVLPAVLKVISPTLPDSTSLEIVDSFGACGGSTSSFSDPGLFQDAIHLNARGYCTVFSQPAVQESFKCSSPNDNDIINDCMSLSESELPSGREQNCVHGGEDSLDEDSSDEDSSSESAYRGGLFVIGVFVAWLTTFF